MTSDEIAGDESTHVESGATSSDIVSTCTVDAEIASSISALPVDLGSIFRHLGDDSLPLARSLARRRPPECGSDIERTDLVVGRRGGIEVRVHRPRAAKSDAPCILWIHGGGFVMGSHLDDGARLDRWCRLYGVVCVSVGYRLAPETPYPGPLEDCYDALRWTREQAAMLEVDHSLIGVAGSSAGGGLAAALTLVARDRGDIPLAFQMLIYPMLDDRTVDGDTTSHDPIWPSTANSYGWSSYLGSTRGGPAVPPYAAPARATDLANLPPALISVGAIDGFFDEDIRYAAKLRHAGVPVELHVYPGAPHGFDVIAPSTSISRCASSDVDRWLARQLRR